MARNIADIVMKVATFGIILLVVMYKVIYLSTTNPKPRDEAFGALLWYGLVAALLIVIALTSMRWLDRHPDPNEYPPEAPPPVSRAERDPADSERG